MPNKNYVKGRTLEYKIIKELESTGHVCIRSAGSHSFADIVAISPEGEVSFIQAKVVSNRTTGERLVREFKANPPLAHIKKPEFNQAIVVHVKPDWSKGMKAQDLWGRVS